MFKDKDETVYFMHVEKDMETKKNTVQKIKQINCLFSTFEVLTIYKEPGETEKLKTMNLDPESDKMIIFSRKSDDRGASLERKNMFKIMDYKNNEILHESEVKDPELIGRLKTGFTPIRMVTSTSITIASKSDMTCWKKRKGRDSGKNSLIFDRFLLVF